jgi:hypothetical protein
MSIFSRLFKLPEYQADLLDHPDLRNMSPNRLADLPLPRPGDAGSTPLLQDKDGGRTPVQLRDGECEEQLAMCK